MPIYELQCTRCGVKEEKLFTTYVHFLTPKELKMRRNNPKRAMKKERAKGYTVKERNEPIVHHPRCACGGDQELLPSMPAMQPDQYWSGRVVHGKYVTSKKEVPRNIEPATREKVEWVAKQKAKRYKEHDEKSAKNLRQFLTQQLSDVTIEPDGTSAKERLNYERARGRNYTGTTDSGADQ